MGKGWFFNYILILLCSTFVYGQIKSDEYFKEKGLSLKVQSSFLYPFDDGDRSRLDSELELEGHSFIIGLNAELNYYFNQHFAAGLGVGYEKLNQPNLYYHPVYFNLSLFANETKESLYAKVNFGTHMGDLSQSGFLFRSGLGYRLKIYKNILSNFEFTYSFQNIYTSYTSFERPSNYYNIESLGISIGIEFN